jgi:hypothetical protein
VFARLGDVRETAVTMGRIADIMEQRGELDEALQIHLKERLPMVVRLRDVDSIAHIRSSCAQLRLARSHPSPSEVQTAVDELRESFALLSELGRADGLAVVGEVLGLVLEAVGSHVEALQVLDVSATAYEKLGRDDKAAAVRARQRAIRERLQRQSRGGAVAG